MPCQYIHQSKLISTIDLLVRDVLFGNIDISHISVQLSKLYLPLLDDYDSALEYSPTINAFKDSTRKVMANPHSQNYRWGYYNTNRFIDYLQIHRDSILTKDKALSSEEKNHSKSLEADLRTHLKSILGCYLSELI